ncbi:hypothetical protein VHUM_03258 [Vanrija humicola]|uniref:Glucose-methanol-choline oxidoreductase N-terminal domain-containing protein n=1 Tax=Vanrija humicola TaxID=5417 RepID=A0A7D8ZIP2_VANHU|nr:hypothetical protein VHUM_03258 [Vanrija humicola]
MFRRALTTNAADVAGKTYDFIIAGGGLAGLTLAGRLAEWSNITVLVIEAGGDGSDVDLQETVPGFAYMKGLSSGPYGWGYKTVNMTDSLNLAKNYPLGKGLGGSGAINGMFWCRGSADDYDAWGAALNPGAPVTWNWAEMQKYINKAENVQMPSAAQAEEFHIILDPKVHGSGGPLQIGFSKYIYPIVANWVPTWQSLGFTNKDLAGGNVRGVTITPSTMDAAKGARSDSRRAYIDPKAAFPNLTVLSRQQVTKILFNSTLGGNLTANGVQFQADAASTTFSVFANKEVIVSGGAINSPKLLQLSGIGPASVLQPLGLPVLADLPVGQGFHDHVSYGMYFNIQSGIDTWFNLATNQSGAQDAALAQWHASADGPLTYVNEAIGYINAADIGFTTVPDVAATVAAVSAKYGFGSALQKGIAAQYAIQNTQLGTDAGQFEIIMHLWGRDASSIAIQVALQHPYSRGHVSIASASPFDPPLIDPDYFGVEADAEMMSAAVGWVRKLVAAPPLSGIITGEMSPGANVTGDDLVTAFKTTSGTEFHPLGTVSMLPKDSGGVVDTSLLVYGTLNVRVVDASVMPLQVAAHLMASTYGVAEKAADIIKAKYAFKPAVTSSSAAPTVKATTSAGSSSAQPTNTAASSSASSPSLSTGAKIGIGVGAGIGAVLLLGAIVSPL